MQQALELGRFSAARITQQVTTRHASASDFKAPSPRESLRQFTQQHIPLEHTRQLFYRKVLSNKAPQQHKLAHATGTLSTSCERLAQRMLAQDALPPRTQAHPAAQPLAHHSPLSTARATKQAYTRDLETAHHTHNSHPTHVCKLSK